MKRFWNGIPGGKLEENESEIDVLKEKLKKR
jgi:hypothetical protein